MVKLLWRFALLVVLALAFAWLADRPGSVDIVWMGRAIHMSVLAAVAIVIAGLILLNVLWRLVRNLWRSPHTAREFWRFRRHRKAYESLSKGIIAAGAGDAYLAHRHAQVAGKTLSDEPLVNVLAAQAAQLKGDREGVKRIFSEMAKSPDTELMGLRGLFAEARQSGDLVAALAHAEKALAKNPRLPWASTSVLQVQAARKLWLPAAKTVEDQGKSGLLPRDEANRKRAALLTAEALQKEEMERDRALELALEAHRLDPALVPAACIAARLHSSSGLTRKAMKVLRETWSLSKHPDLVDLAARAQTGDGPEARFERVRDFVGSPEGEIEGACGLARAALAARRLDVARKALSGFVEDRPQARVCALMGEIEDADGDRGKSREWFARAVHAPRDPMWVSDGVASPRWQPVSPVTGEIVPCEWKVPFDMLPAQEPSGGIASTEDLPSITLKTPPSGPPKQVPFERPPDDPGVDAEPN